MNKKFRIGDTVIITNGGSTYPSASYIAEKLGATRWICGEFSQNYMSLNGKKGIILGIYKKDAYYNILLVDIGESEILIGDDGIKLYKKSDPKIYGIVNFCKNNYK